MARHELDEATVRAEQGSYPDAVERYEYAVSGRGGHGRARAQALATVALAYGCKVALRNNDSSNRTRHLLIVGAVASLRSLRTLLPAIELQMEAAARAAAQDRDVEAGPLRYRQ